MSTIHFNTALTQLPLVAILRGIKSDEVETIALTLYEQGFRLIEIPMNSPDALNSVAKLAKCLPQDALIGAGTVLQKATVAQLKDAGAGLVVMPHIDVDIIRAAVAAGLVCIPGAATPSEIFTGLNAGASAIKLFPAELVHPAIVKAMRAVLSPAVKLLPVGGITPDNMSHYLQAGASGFGLGSALYTPGMTAHTVTQRARAFIQSWQRLSNPVQ
jgi:2-dehydro-3-deoxyphosphogalactonate aldolase